MVINAKEEINERRNHTEHSFDESKKSRIYLNEKTNKSRILTANEERTLLWKESLPKLALFYD